MLKLTLVSMAAACHQSHADPVHHADPDPFRALAYPTAVCAQVPITRLLVVYDDLDLPTAKVRLRAKGGHGGHNGMRSIVSQLGGNKDFPRIRIGVCSSDWPNNCVCNRDVHQVRDIHFRCNLFTMQALDDHLGRWQLPHMYCRCAFKPGAAANIGVMLAVRSELTQPSSRRHSAKQSEKK